MKLSRVAVMASPSFPEHVPERYKRNAYRFTWGACLICERAGVRLVMDHCHAHGWTRGRICESCNQVLWHEERRYAVAELLSGLCFHRHRSAEAAERCRAKWRTANARRIEHYRRCPDCDRLYPLVPISNRASR